ncbi:MAG: NIPSNAP family protein, partial [Acetobacteraceae bacterium]
LNQIIHVWPYESFEHRTAVRAAAAKEEGWPPPIREFVTAQQSEVFIPAPFSPRLEPMEVGPVFEIRAYTLAPGAIPEMIRRWEAKIEERVKLSPLVGAWYSEFGALNRWIHIWAYKDAAERQRIRADAVARGLWPPGGAASGIVIKQENTLVMPSSFSPIR